MPGTWNNGKFGLKKNNWYDMSLPAFTARHSIGPTFHSRHMRDLRHSIGLA